MPNAILFEDRSWIFPGDDYEAPKPMRSREIARLGDAVDETQFSPDWDPDRVDAEVDFMIAIRNRVWFDLAKARASKRVPSLSDGRRLKTECVEASNRVDGLLAAAAEAKAELMRSNRRFDKPQKWLGPTTRELLEARAALALAESKFKIAQRKYRDAKKQAEADKRAGIVRRGYGTKTRTVTDGYVRTGKYKMIDGVRVPMLEKVE